MKLYKNLDRFFNELHPELSGKTYYEYYYDKLTLEEHTLLKRLQPYLKNKYILKFILEEEVDNRAILKNIFRNFLSTKTQALKQIITLSRCND
jgi:hypothetical protein